MTARRQACDFARLNRGMERFGRCGVATNAQHVTMRRPSPEYVAHLMHKDLQRVVAVA
jgi:hypothetical protein